MMKSKFVLLIVLISWLGQTYAQTDCPDITITNIQLIASPTCSPSDGMIIVEATDTNNEPLEYSVDGGNNYQTSSTFTGLVGNTLYTIYARYQDQNYSTCTKLAGDHFLDEYAPPSIQSVTPTDASDCMDDGSIVINATGEKPLEYSIDGENWQTSNTFSNLYNGVYYPQVQYRFGDPCTILGNSLTLDGLAAPIINKVIPYHPTESNTTDGSITILAEGGTGSLSYRIDFGSWTSNPVFENLGNGTYYVQVRNSNGTCTIDIGDVVLNNTKRCGGMTFNSQAAIETFFDNNPDCTILDGDVMVNGEDITSLARFSNITHIEGYLWVNNNSHSSFTSLNGLENIVSVGGYVKINFNNNLATLEGLQNLSNIDDYLWIEANHALPSLEGLENLLRIGNFLTIGNNDHPAFTSLQGLENLETIEGVGLAIWQNENIQSLSALSGLTFPNEEDVNEIIISSNPKLTYCAIDALCSFLPNPPPGVNIIIHNNSPDGFCDSETEILNACNCFPDGITFNTQESIDRFPIDYPNCSIINGFVRIDDFGSQDIIYNLDGLNGITQINGYLTIYDIEELVNLNGLQNLQSVGNYFYIDECPNLSSIEELQSLNSIGGYLGLAFNDKLTSISGLPNLTTIGSSLIITTSSISSITGLQNLNTIGGTFELSLNQDLEVITGLQNISFANQILFHHNPLLSTCGIPVVCDYVSSLNNSEVSTRFYENGAGCNDQAFDSGENDLYEACAIGFEIQDATGVANTTVTVPCVVRNFQDIGGFYINVLIPSSVGTVIGVGDFGLPGFDESNFSTIGNTMQIEWGTSPDINLPDDATIFTIDIQLENQTNLNGTMVVELEDYILQSGEEVSNVIFTNGTLRTSSTVYIEGSISDILQNPISDMDVTLASSFPNSTVTINTEASNEYYHTHEVFVGQNVTVFPSKMGTPTDGVNLLDILLINAHLDNSVPFGTGNENAWKYIAAKVTGGEGAISQNDVDDIKAVLLGHQLNYQGFNNWMFYPTDYDFVGTYDLFPTHRDYNNIQSSHDNQDYTGVKIGDLTQDNINLRPNSSANVQLTVSNVSGSAGSTVTLEVTPTGFVDVTGFEFSLTWDDAILSYQSVQDFGINGMTINDFGLPSEAGVADNELRVLWEDYPNVYSLDGSSPLFSITFLIDENAPSGTTDVEICPASCPNFYNNSPAALLTSTQNGQVSVGVLPLDLLRFVGKANELQNIELFWQTTTESQVSHYDIEHSLDGKNFTYLGKVAAAGTSNNSETYSFSHQKPALDIHYYRLKIVEENGAIEYSNTISVQLKEDNSSELVLFPNPASTQVQVILPTSMDSLNDVQVSIFNHLGQEVMTLSLVEASIDIADLPEGIYLFQVRQATEVVSGQLIKF